MIPVTIIVVLICAGVWLIVLGEGGAGPGDSD